MKFDGSITFFPAPRSRSHGLSVSDVIASVIVIDKPFRGGLGPRLFS